MFRIFKRCFRKNEHKREKDRDCLRRIGSRLVCAGGDSSRLYFLCSGGGSDRFRGYPKDERSSGRKRNRVDDQSKL